MDTNRIRRFATEARNKLKDGIAAKIRTLGFDPKGDVPEEQRPRLMQGGTHWNDQLLPEAFYHQWMSLYRRVGLKGMGEVCEEAAYTWFNRLCAIRILQKNDLCAPVIDYADAARTPVIVDEARQGRLPAMDEGTRTRLVVLLDDDTRVTEQFAVLINAWCRDNPVIFRCFGAMADYTELLLPANILAEGGFVDMLNHTEFITEADYRSPELIGWLYQFYIAERKDEVFARKGKFTADEIPAATQIFTPGWIVKYMVQNTVGRIYLDNNPYETQLPGRWQYLVEPAGKPSADAVLRYEELTDLRVADLACGSGHILNECFDLLYELYIAEGYGRAEAIENIFRRNLTGVDIDLRAKQMAMFSLLLKACQRDAGFADGHCLPRVLSVPKVDRYTFKDREGHFCRAYQVAHADEQVGKEMTEAFTLMEQADSLGSIMKFDVSDETRQWMRQCIEAYEATPQHEDAFRSLIEGYRLMLALTEKYHALVMNPPYMGNGNMNEALSKYVKEEYEEGKADLATVFVQMMSQQTVANGRYAFIIPPSWMFLSTFESLRKKLIANQTIDSLLHLSRGVFGADFGASSAVIANVQNDNAKGTYFRLIERTFQEFDQKHLRMLFEKTLANHDFRYFFADYSKDVEDIVYSEQGAKIYYPNVEQKNFEKIPGCPIGYWVSECAINNFRNKTLGECYFAGHGLLTGHDESVIRHWFEASYSDIDFTSTSLDEFHKKGNKYSPLNKGGESRKWYGNLSLIVKYDYDAINVLSKYPKFTPQNSKYYFTNGATWSEITSKSISARFMPNGCIFSHKSPTAFTDSEEMLTNLVGFMCSSVCNYYLILVNPTISCSAGTMNKVPVKDVELWPHKEAEENISISREDWDTHETSWDFQSNPLLSIDESTYQDNVRYEAERQEEATGEPVEVVSPAPPQWDSLAWRMEQFKQKWERKFMQLHANEEELNRRFIDIYGLQGELTPDVPLSEITILQQGEISIE